MKKTIKIFFLIITVLAFFGCDNQTPDLSDEIDVTDYVKDVTLKYNDWGTCDYSFLQSSEDCDVSELFDGELPKTGDSFTVKWTGKSNRDVKKLHLLVVSLRKYTDPRGYNTAEWTHLLSEEKRMVPVAEDITAGEEFTIEATVELDKYAEHSVNIYLCCGLEDAAGPVHLYSTETEDTTAYDKYMAEGGRAIENALSGIKVERKGKIEYSKKEKKIKFKSYPKIQYTNRSIADGSTAEGKQDLLNKGYFSVWFRGDDLKEDYFITIGNPERNTCNHGDWGGIKTSFADLDLSGQFKESSKIEDKPIYGQCVYYVLANSEKPGTTKEEELGREPCFYYFPLVAFDVSYID